MVVSDQMSKRAALVKRSSQAATEDAPSRPGQPEEAGHQDYGAALKAGARQPAAYAASAIASRGRTHTERDCPTRSPFQRDRDRILHASAFRRLTYKTQVFVFHEGDHYRTRLTHSLEVAQIARTMARQLQLDEDLAETLALAHDLGHSPFGHAGERALDRAMADVGGFDHNAQSIRVVTALERRYADFDGLNLTWETLEGLAKHNGPISDSNNPVARVLRSLQDWQDFELDQYASAEAQVAAIADDIAYLNHDIDDGLRAGLLTIPQLTDAPFTRDIIQGADETLQSLSSDHAHTRAIYELTRRMITTMIADVISQTRKRFAAANIQTPADIRMAGHQLVVFSDDLQAKVSALKAFLFEHVYRHRHVMRIMEGAQSIVLDLYAHYQKIPADMQPDWAQIATEMIRDDHSAGHDRRLARLVGDYVAGMTDRFAIAEHRRLFDATPDLR
ncbi:MAG: deoxyguanosinetriphosphate triphosphohydrolase [Pseudomonadota bacterium]